MVRHSLDVAALGSAVLRRLIGQTPCGELHGHALATLQIARDSADLVHVGGHILHVIDVRRYSNDMILHASDRHNLAGDLRIGDDLILDRGDGLIGLEVLGGCGGLDVGNGTCHCHGLVLDGRHRLDGLDVLSNGLDRLDVVCDGLDLGLHRHEDGGRFGVLSGLQLGLLRLFGGLLGGIGELSCIVLNGHQLLNQLFWRTVRCRRNGQCAPKALN